MASFDDEFTHILNALKYGGYPRNDWGGKNSFFNKLDPNYQADKIEDRRGPDPYYQSLKIGHGQDIYKPEMSDWQNYYVNSMKPNFGTLTDPFVRAADRQRGTVFRNNITYPSPFGVNQDARNDSQTFWSGFADRFPKTAEGLRGSGLTYPDQGWQQNPMSSALGINDVK